MSAEAELVKIDIKAYMQDVGRRARGSSRDIGRAETGAKNTALLAIADLIDAHGAGRRRVTLHVLFARGGVLAGFMEGRSHRLLDLDRCPILAPDLADDHGSRMQADPNR